MVILEVIATSAEDVRIAGESGADRIELVVGLAEGALTPSIGFLELVSTIATIPVFVMIRPRNGVSIYSENELLIMIKDAKAVQQLGLSGIVTGVLTPAHTIDTKAMTNILDACAPLPVVFHRAFDQVQDPYKALLDIIGLGPRMKRVLSSGLTDFTIDGLPLIKNLVEIAGSRLSIMPGTAITADNIRQIIEETGITDIHLRWYRGKAGCINGKLAVIIIPCCMHNVARGFGRVRFNG